MKLWQKARILAIVLLVLPKISWQKTAEEWKSRVIYQILTDRFSQAPANPSTPCTSLKDYCGGTYQGIISKLDYLQDLGIDAIWISPFVKNTPKGYHGYWAENINQVNPYFGSAADLLELISECHARDIWVMMDVVPNHMGVQTSCSGPEECLDPLDYSQFSPFNVPEHYHDFCIIEDFENQVEVEICRLFYLCDLNQTVPFVRDTLYDWIATQTNTFGFDGYRIDTVRHVNKNFWSGYQSAAGTYVVGEVAGNETKVSYIASYQDVMDGVLNFPLYYSLRRVFNEQYPMTFLRDNIEEQRAEFRDLSITGAFVDNHDFPRFLNLTYDFNKIKSALAFVLFGNGIPIIYAGTELGFHGGNDPDNRESMWPYFDQHHELYLFIQDSLKARKVFLPNIIHAEMFDIKVTNETYVYGRGNNFDIIVAVSSRPGGQNTGYSIHIDDINLPDGTRFWNIYSDNEIITVMSGTLTISFSDDQAPKVYEREQLNELLISVV